MLLISPGMTLQSLLPSHGFIDLEMSDEASTSLATNGDFVPHAPVLSDSMEALLAHICIYIYIHGS
jgi:hypothetical protein